MGVYGKNWKKFAIGWFISPSFLSLSCLRLLSHSLMVCIVSSSCRPAPSESESASESDGWLAADERIKQSMNG